MSTIENTTNKKNIDIQSRQYKKMTETPIPKLVVSLGIPTTISMLVTNIYNMADTHFVGKEGTSASGAVGVVFGLMAIIQAFGFMFGHGAGSIISRRLGSKDTKSASLYASTSFFYAIGTGILISILGLGFINPLMRLLGSTKTILPYSRTYATFILIAAPFMTASCVLNNILRYESRAIFAMVGLTSGAVINILLDYILMVRYTMGIKGAGIATCISQIISFFILLFMFLSGKTQSKLSIKNFCKDFSYISLICRTGFPSLIRQGLSSISTMALNANAKLYGDAAVAAMGIVGRISFFIFAVGLGIGQGFQPVAAFNYGAKKYSRVKKAYFFTAFLGELLMGTCAILGIIWAPEFISFFRRDPEVIRIGLMALRLQALMLLLHPFSVCSNMMFQSIGKNKIATLLSMLRSGLCFIPILFILSNTLHLTGIQIAQPIADLLTFLITMPFTISFLKTLKD